MTVALALILTVTTRPAAAGGFPDANSFLTVTNWNDIDARWVDADTIEFGLGSDPYFVYGGVKYDVTNLWMVGVIDDQRGLGSVGGTDVGAWTFARNDGAASDTAGWKNPSKSQALLPGGPKRQFTFTGLNPGVIDGYAFHVTVDGTFPGTGAATGGIRLDGNTPPQDNPVPEPAFYQLAGLLGLGGLSLLRGRRRQA